MISASAKMVSQHLLRSSAKVAFRLIIFFQQFFSILLVLAPWTVVPAPIVAPRSEENTHNALGRFLSEELHLADLHNDEQDPGDVLARAVAGFHNNDSTGVIRKGINLRFRF